MWTNDEAARDLVITGALGLMPDEGLLPVEIRCADGMITEAGNRVSRAGAEVIDAKGCHLLPGIIDIHGDAFERQIMPRPKTMFPLDVAMSETDRQLVANGITTAYHGITVSWEPGLRGLDEAKRIIAALDALEPALLADNRIHLRWETYAVDQADDVVAMFSRAKKPLLAFNDHTTQSLSGKRNDIKIRSAADRAMVDPEAYHDLLSAIAERQDDVEPAIENIIINAQSGGIAMLSHDDCTIGMRRAFRARGVNVAEFPMNWDTIGEAAEAGDDIVLGAPNVMRGGSHNGAISAGEAVRRRLCTILASDYYYPAQLSAALMLARHGVLPLEQSWALVSEAPARACGLSDRGRIAEGLRADLVLVPAGGSRPVATIAAGRIAYRCF